MRDFQRVLLVFLGLLGGANGAAPAYPPASPRRAPCFLASLLPPGAPLALTRSPRPRSAMYAPVDRGLRL